MRLLVRDAARSGEAALALAAPGVQIAIAGRELGTLLATVRALRGAGAEVWGELLGADDDDQAFAAAARERCDGDFDQLL